MTKALVPTLAMLWEDDDPAEVLEQRFGFASPGAAVDWVAATLEEHWGLTVDECDRVILSADNALAWVRSDADRWVAKWSPRTDRFGRVKDLAELTAWLSEQDLPVSEPIAARGGELQVEVDGSSLSLQREISGDLLDPLDLPQARAAGEVLAQLHLSLARYPQASTLDLGEPVPLGRRVTDWLDSDPKGASPDARRMLGLMVRNAPPSPVPPQLVHGDFRSANVLWAADRVAAVLDFEEARWDHPVDELARSAVLLGTRYRNWGPVSGSVRSAFLTGYQSVRPLHPSEMAWWNVQVPWYTLMMTPSSGEDPTGWAEDVAAQVAELSGEG